MKLRFLWMAGALVLIPVLGFPTAQHNPVGKSVEAPSKAVVNSRPIRTKSFPVRPESERQQVCCQIVVYDWTNAHVGDTIVVFDENYTFEKGGEIRTITDISSSSNGHRTITLNAPLSHSYWASTNDGQNPPHPTFANGHSGGFGVIYSTHSINGTTITDTDPNQINGPGSAFYDADMRDIKQPFDDAYVQFVALRSGMGAVPYVPGDYFDWVFADELHRLDNLNYFSNTWFLNKQVSPQPPTLVPHNYFHLVGASASSTAYGMTWYVNDWTFIFQDTLEASLPSTTDRMTAQQWVCDHELGHQFNVNPELCSGHDTRDAWCDNQNHCGLGGSTTIHCLMNVSGTASEYEAQILDGINRFDLVDLLTGGESSSGSVNCGGLEKPWNRGDGAIRTDTDPQ